MALPLVLFLMLTLLFLLVTGQTQAQDTPPWLGPAWSWMAHLLPALLMAWTGALFCGLARRAGASERAAAALTLVLMLCTACLVCAHSASGPGLQTALQTALLLWFTAGALRQGERPTPAGLAALGLAAGGLCNAGLELAMLLPLLALPAGFLAYQMQQRGEARRASLLAISALTFLPGLALALWRWRHQRPAVPASAGPSFHGALLPELYGLLLSSGKGLLCYSPPLILGLLGVPLAWRRRPAETALLLSLVVVILLTQAHHPAAWAEPSWGPRALTPLTPLLLLLAMPWLPTALHHGQRGLRRLAVAALCTAGLFIQVLGVAFPAATYLQILRTVREQSGAAGWFYTTLGPVEYVPQFSPIAGHLWMLSHRVRHEVNVDVSKDAPWRLLVPQKVDLKKPWAAVRVDLAVLDWLRP